MAREDLLNEDPPVFGQKWVCLSFLSPEGVRGCTVRGVKIRGSYDTREDADKQAKKLRELDPDFNVFVGEVGKWLPWDPDPNSIEDQVYAEKELNELMHGYKENLTEARKVEEQRKRDMKATGNTKSESKTKDRLRKKLEERNKLSEEEIEKLKHDEKLLEEKIEQATEIKQTLNAEEKDLSNFNKIKKLYEEINKH